MADKRHIESDVTDLESEKPKKALRGAAGGIYIGPIISSAAIQGPSSPTHATGAAAGGVEDSTGYREKDSYEASGSAALMVATTRPTGRTMYRGPGIQGGSTPGLPVDFGADHLKTGAFDERSALGLDGGFQLGGGRGTQVLDETVTFKIDRPTLQASEANFGDAGREDVVQLVDGVGAIDADVDPITVTKYPSGKLELFVYERGTDTDEDAGLVGKGDWDLSATQSEAYGAAAGPAALATGTYAVYAKFIDQDNIVGPMSARFELAVS